MTMHIGETLGIPTIDVEHEVLLPETWTDAYWFDVIHLTAAGSAEVARVVASHLVAPGASEAGPLPAATSRDLPAVDLSVSLPRGLPAALLALTLGCRARPPDPDGIVPITTRATPFANALSE